MRHCIRRECTCLPADDIPQWGFDAMFPAMHSRNNTIIYNEFSNLGEFAANLIAFRQL